MEKYYVDAAGNFLGTYVGFQPADIPLIVDGEPTLDDSGAAVMESPPYVEPAAPEGAIEVPMPPADGRDKWDGKKYVPHVEPPPPIDTAALVNLLIKKGLLSQADIAAQLEVKT